MAGKFMYTTIWLLCNALIRLGVLRWRLADRANLPPREAGGMVIAMNHIHWIDIVAVGSLLPLRYRPAWLAKSELFEHPLAGWWLRQMDVISIRRGKRDVAALYAAEDALKAGAVLLIFPEGHRSRTGVLQPGRGGAVRLAARGEVPILPVAITGTQHGMGTLLRRREIVLQIGTPYRVPLSEGEKIPPDTMTALNEAMMRQIAAMLPHDWRGPYQNETVSNVARHEV